MLIQKRPYSLQGVGIGEMQRQPEEGTPRPQHLKIRMPSSHNWDNEPVSTKFRKLSEARDNDSLDRTESGSLEDFLGGLGFRGYVGFRMLNTLWGLGVRVSRALEIRRICSTRNIDEKPRSTIYVFIYPSICGSVYTICAQVRSCVYIHIYI